MIKYLISIGFCAYLFVTINSCKKPENLYSTFPNNIGTWWKYSVVNRLTHTVDTVLIKIVGSTILDNGEPAKLWAINSLINGSDTNYVTTKIDGIRIYSSRMITASPFKRYLFPMNVGNYWVTQNILDTNRITERGTINVPAGTFSNGYRINRNIRELPNLNVIKEDEWFVNDIGFVYRDYDYNGFNGGESKLWELISYQISK